MKTLSGFALGTLLIVLTVVFGGRSALAADLCEEQGGDFCIPVHEAYEMLLPENDPDDHVILLDIRKPEEWFFIGRPGANKAGEGSEYAHKVRFANFKGNSFLYDVKEIIEDTGIVNPTIILICRSGDRSYNAAKLLMANDYEYVYSVIDGFEGDRNAITGYRDVNGWIVNDLPYNPYPYEAGEF